jgi:hypothetical protein
MFRSTFVDCLVDNRKKMGTATEALVGCEGKPHGGCFVGEYAWEKGGGAI